MREIKFRGKTTKTGRWLYGNLQVPRMEGVPYYMLDEEKFQREVDAETICQYTGLKDKNGKEIYEGDIIRSFDSSGDIILHYIVWKEEEARFVAFYKGKNFSSKCFLKQDWIDEFEKEVVGNIHDNDLQEWHIE